MNKKKLSDQEMRFLLQCVNNPDLRTDSLGLYKLLGLYYSLNQSSEDRGIVLGQIKKTWPELDICKLSEGKTKTIHTTPEVKQKNTRQKKQGKLKLLRSVKFEFKGKQPASNKDYQKIFADLLPRINVFYKQKESSVSSDFQQEYSALHVEVMFFLQSYRNFVKKTYNLGKDFYVTGTDRLHPKWQSLFLDLLKKNRDEDGKATLGTYQKVKDVEINVVKKFFV